MGKVRKAAASVDATADWIRYLAQKIDKYGVRLTVVQFLPKPIIDVTIKKKK
jgi:hypothetical protein